MAHRENGIPTQGSAEWMHPEVQFVRNNADRYMRELVEEGVIDSRALQGSSVLEGGFTSSCHFRRDVIKFKPWAKPTEADVLKAWKENGVRVPKVKAHGVVPSTSESEIPVTYMVLEAIRDQNGKIAPMASDFTEEHPESLPQIGHLMGVELAKMHQAQATGLYGSRSVISAYHNQSSTWGEYLEQEVARHDVHLLKMGFSPKEVEQLLMNLGSISVPTKTILDGDYSIRNVLVSSTQPITIYTIDPNALVGDRHWDLAPSANRVETAKKTWECDPSEKNEKTYAQLNEFYRALRAAYEDASGVKIDDTLLVASQLPRSLKNIDWLVQDVARQGDRKDSRLILARAKIKEQAEKLLALPQ